MDSISALVDRLGGIEAVARRFDLGNKAVEMWIRRGFIPPRWHVPLLLWAEEKAVPLSLGEVAKRYPASSELEPAEARA